MAQKIYDLVIVGGGASGIMAAVVASRKGASIAIIEKNNRLGEKLRISGGGRCNITNAEFDLRALLKNYGKAEQFLYSAFTEFGVRDTIDFFEEIGLPIKIEARKRAFPVSDSASDVVHALTHELHKYNVDIITDTRVTRINHSKTTIFSITCGNRTVKGRNYILASGGTSRPETGSTGDGFDWLEQLGHSVKSPTPSITPLKSKESWVKKVSGTSLKGARITFYCDGIKAFRLDGDILFTHFGISGPIILSNAYRVAELLEQGRVTAKIDCLPTVDSKDLDARIVELLHQNGGKQVKNLLRLIAPEGLAPMVAELTANKINLDTKAGELGKNDRKTLLDSIKELPLTIEALMGVEKAVVADGGVSLKEIDTRTFKSNIIDNLYVTGDLLDITRPSGGYSLQLCWTSGYIAGSSYNKYNERDKA